MVFQTHAVKAIPKDLFSKLWAAKVTRVSLKQIYAVGKVVQDSQSQNALMIPAQFLHEELPIRYIQTLRMLNSDHELPHQFMTSTQTFRNVTQRYLEDVSALTRFPKPDTIEKEREFTDLLRILQKRHKNNVLSLGVSFKELSELAAGGAKSVSELDEGRAQRFFDRFYGISLGTNLLIGEHLALHDEGVNLVQKISPFQIAEKAANDARNVCGKHFNCTAPEVKIIAKDPSVRTTYISEHLHRILFEVLKNSLRATIDTHATSRTLPPLKVIIVNGGEDVSIKISDEGGGIPISKMSSIWSYKMVSDDSDRLSDVQLGEVKDYLELPLAGFGHGLPVARLTARYFGGDLNLVSMEGYGTDAYVSLYRDSSYPENFPENPIIKRTLGMEFIDMQRDESLHPEVRDKVEMDVMDELVMDRVAMLGV